MNKARIYLVADATDTQAPPRLVRAVSQSQAIKHVTKPFSATVATQDDLIDALDNGVKVENACAEEGLLP